jgi:hypothetical protein
MLLLGGGAAAQTTTPPPTTAIPCPAAASGGPATAAPNLVAFSVERVLDPTQISSTFPATFPAGLATAVSSKVMEIREGITFNSANQVLTINLFPVQTGAPIPTPANSITPGTIFGTLALKVDKVYTSCTPNASVMFAGTVATNTPSSPFGNLSGEPAAVSVGLSSTGSTSTTTPPNITNVAVLIAGTAVEFSAAGSGTITFTSGPVAPPGSTGGPNIVVASAGPTAYRIVDLDASGTTSTGGGTLTFKWIVVAGAADVANPTMAKATAYIQGGAGVYTFRVTVTDSQGNVSSKDVNVQFL